MAQSRIHANLYSPIKNFLRKVAKEKEDIGTYNTIIKQIETFKKHTLNFI